MKKCISVINSETIENDQSVKENEFVCFWEKRKREASAWGLLLTTSNTIYALISLLKPPTKESRYMAIIYMIGSVISYMSFALYYSKKADSIYLTTIYYTMRNSLRMIDLEKTRP